ncbi:MAG: GNAT family N-acetyltransferase, partial [Bacteroidales bacterium]|nr:GNAT family N-acetyltransferase [Clostridium sp.]MCM1203990.1 GNAT family N-acetyltransferase [Bacteroidales bacterium]
IGIDLVENKRNRGIAPRAIRLFAKKVCEEKQVEYFLIRISSNNLHSQHIFEKLGAVKIGEEESAFSKFVERFGEIAGKSEQDLEGYKYLFGEDGDEVVYRYRLNPNF